ncbi:cob(I)yrinic acid a,c-diamide adenosyltransferase [Alkalihalobacillus pseudalcaliphilus]|uniref:cob(I)yrinic acid a,c-diamide adenosyltransferase n=1 Tax=Alkalihalobacillus pseudalcaliphilus TaxID=79884 RepID=UPI00064E0AD9|nr:cob(I)yrinic acid a,c-diamide adenosyltransferase [Alkalihalobacillus pseudalcaliphilus]KMK76490.1 ATP:cob(I)alamin adenosyltransferase [Alkalihalobacillus pseudalcaliphilus]
MKLYTKTGDSGQTSVVGGRVAKDHVRVEAYGTLDELNSFVGLAISSMSTSEFNDMIEDLFIIQHELFDCGSDLAFVMSKTTDPTFKVKEEMVEHLEGKIDSYMEESPPLEKFILPGGSQAASYLHVCRTITRRAERLIVSLQKEIEINPVTLTYINRLSDLFFVLARAANTRQKINDVEYERSAIVFKERKSKQ